MTNEIPSPQPALVWHGLSQAEVLKVVGEICDYGTGFVAPLISVVKNIDKLLRERNATAPVPIPASEGADAVAWLLGLPGEPLADYAVWRTEPTADDIRLAAIGSGVGGFVVVPLFAHPAAAPAQSPAEGDEPAWYAVTSLRAPVIDKVIRRLDVAEEYADKKREVWPDVEVSPLYYRPKAEHQPKGITDIQRRVIEHYRFGQFAADMVSMPEWLRQDLCRMLDELEQVHSPKAVPPRWVSDQIGGEFDDLTAGQGYRKGWNDCRDAFFAAGSKKGDEPDLCQNCGDLPHPGCNSEFSAEPSCRFWGPGSTQAPAPAQSGPKGEAAADVLLDMGWRWAPELEAWHGPSTAPVDEPAADDAGDVCAVEDWEQADPRRTAEAVYGCRCKRCLAKRQERDAKLAAAQAPAVRDDRAARAWAALTEPLIDEFLEDYEMVGEDEAGRDACHVPTEGERFLIKDAVMGLLQAALDHADASHVPVQGSQP